MNIDNNYKNIVQKVLEEGYLYNDPNRKGVQRLEIPSYTFRHEFKDGFPAISTKKLAWKSVVTELIWFLKGDTNIKYLLDNGCNIWNKDAYNYYLKQCETLKLTPLQMSAFITDVKEGKTLRNTDYTFGDLGKVYGHYWRKWGYKKTIHPSGTITEEWLDQIKTLIRDMVEKPMSSELLVVARNPRDSNNQALPCCHYGFQIVMRPLTTDERLEILGDIHTYKISAGKAKLDSFMDAFGVSKYGFELHWKQRSCDLFLGIPFNIASYALLALILEKITGHKALGIQGDLKKVHLYDNSVEATKKLIKRKCSKERVLLQSYPLTEIMDEFDNKLFNLDAFISYLDEVKEDIELIGYNPQPPMRVEMLERK